MAALAAASTFANALRAEGVKVVEIPGWGTHNRDGAGRAPNNPSGIIVHHTGGDTTAPETYARGLLWGGRSDLPGPLCDAGISDDGTLYLVGHGRTNHAGGGDPAVLAIVQADAAPLDRELRPTRGNSNGVDGNSHFHGWEVMYSGGHPMSPAQYNATVRACAAVCRLYGWSAGSVIAHREWSSDKPDPGNVSMPAFRRDVAAALALPAGRWGSVVSPAAPKDDDDMALSTEAQAQLDRIERAAQAALNTVLTGRPDQGLGGKDWPYPFSMTAASYNALSGVVTQQAALKSAVAAAAASQGVSLDADKFAADVAARLAEGQQVTVTAASPSA